MQVYKCEYWCPALSSHAAAVNAPAHVDLVGRLQTQVADLPQGFGLAATVYSTGRALVPSPLAGVAGSLESTVTNISMPVITAVQDQSGRVRPGTRKRASCPRWPWNLVSKRV